MGLLAPSSVFGIGKSLPESVFTADPIENQASVAPDVVAHVEPIPDEAGEATHHDHI